MAQAKKKHAELQAEHKTRLLDIRQTLEQLKGEPSVTTTELLGLIEKIVDQIVPPVNPPEEPSPP